MTYEHVLSPLRVGPVELPNRVVRTAHGTGSLATGGINPDFIAYHEARGRGGFGMSVLEAASVHPSSPARLKAFDDAVVDGYRALTAAVRPTGMLMMQQLYHAGHHLAPPDGSPPWSASDIPSVRLGLTPVAISPARIGELVDGFAAAAVRARDGGLDGVQIHAAHGYLIHQFLSPLTNRRTDDYGGSPAGRSRLLVEVLQEVRARVGHDIAVGVRLSATEYEDEGMGPSGSAALAAMLETAGLVDFIDISVGEYRRFHKVIGAMHEPAGYQLDAARVVAAAVTVPTILAGRITTLASADELVADGTTDLVAMVRASIADPDLVRKSRQGRASEVRPCIGCNQGCVAGMVSGRLSCVVNPAAGLELAGGASRLPVPRPVRVPGPVSVPGPPSRRRVLVIGGGPAGMEAARVAAAAGHTVRLFESGSELGGQLRFAARAPHRRDIAEFTGWLIREISRNGVEVTLDVAADAALIGSAGADVVVVATGSTPRRDGFQSRLPALQVPGVEQAHVVTSREVLDSAAPVRRGQAVVLDDIGHYEAVAAAEHLLAQGMRVMLVTQHDRLAPLLEDAAVADPARARLGAAGLDLLGRSALVEIRSASCRVVSFDSGTERDLRADLVVLVSGNVPSNGLADELSGGGAEIHVVGDARGPRYLGAAVAEAHWLAQSL